MKIVLTSTLFLSVSSTQRASYSSSVYPLSIFDLASVVFTVGINSRCNSTWELWEFKTTTQLMTKMAWKIVGFISLFSLNTLAAARTSKALKTARTVYSLEVALP